MIPKESLSFLEIGQTTKADVREKLGRPPKTNEADTEWTYRLRSVMSGRFGLCVAIPDADPQCGITDGKLVLQILKIDFNDAGVVSGWDKFDGILPWAYESTRLYAGLEKRDGLLFESQSTSPFTGQHSWFYDNGRIAGQVTIRDGVEDGPYTTWHPDGPKDTEQHYKNGKLNGPKIIWYNNGRKSSQDQYKDDLRHGLMTLWEPDGTVFAQICYQDDEMINLTPEKCTP